MQKRSLKIRFLILFLWITSSLISVACAQSKPGPIDDLSCVKDSDCISSVEGYASGCLHYCGVMKSDKCDQSIKVCPASNRTKAPSPSCYISRPCYPPKKIWCEQGKCKSE